MLLPGRQSRFHRAKLSRFVAGVFAFGCVLSFSFGVLAADPVNPANDWSGNRKWIGPDWWANPLTEWSLSDGAAVAPAAADRTLCLLTRDLELKREGDRFLVETDLVFRGDTDAKKHAAGFRLGRRGKIDDYRHSLVHATDWMDFKIDPSGKLYAGKATSQGAISDLDSPVRLRLSGVSQGDQTEVTLTATQDTSTVSLQTKVPSESLAGGISLFTDGPSQGGLRGAEAEVAFSNFAIGGKAVTAFPERRFGPILWSQYTLHRNQVRLLAQMAPLDSGEKYQADLLIAAADGPTQWKQIATSPVDPVSRTAIFDLPDWDASRNVDYRVQLRWRGKDYHWDGTIRQEPLDRETFKLACFSCDNGYLFPIPPMVEQVSRQDPDMLFFAGDQIYESYGGFGVMRGGKTDIAIIDFMRKYHQFGWTWRTLLRDRPSVILPDDHDVFQGNIWGHGGRPLPSPAGKASTANAKPDWTLGGYLMPGDWVAAVERMHVGHLPDPAVDMTLPIGIKPYFTKLNYAGIGFAILEDRKFKTGPKSLPLAKRARGEGAELLGPQQEAFLKQWCSNWDGHVMKCALSQTIFCKAATHTGPALKRGKGGGDSGGWPTAARDRVVRMLADGNALSIHGDQHLGVLLQQGIEEFGDAGFAFMVPGTANGWPRAWWPGYGNEAPPNGIDFTGKHRDDFGNPLTFLAVGNPEPGSNKIPKSADPMEIGYRKGSGYGLVEFNKTKKTATISLYRLGNKEEQFDGFPQTVTLGGEPMQTASSSSGARAGNR